MKHSRYKNNAVTLVWTRFTNTVRLSYLTTASTAAVFTAQILAVFITVGNCQQVQGGEWQRGSRSGCTTHALCNSVYLQLQRFVLDVAREYYNLLGIAVSPLRT